LPKIGRHPRLLLALPDGKVVEHPTLIAPVRAGDAIGVAGADEKTIPLPAGGTLSSLPGQRPIGIDPDTGDQVVLREVRVGGRTVRPDAVAAVLPPGFTRTYLPVAHRTPLAPMLPQWAYTAAGWDDGGGFVVHALHTDRRGHWSPLTHSTAELAGRVAERRSEGRLLNQLARCALEYRCFTAQNVFYGRDEGAIPASVGCNAKCVGCISEQLAEEGIASHERMDAPPSSEEMAALGVRHLSMAEESLAGRAMVSFGQGCEGEPLTRAHHISRAIKLMRAETRRGSININTNGSRPKALALLIEAGLDACRVSLNSARQELYEAYYRPVDYSWDSVRETLRIARDGGLYIALNLLTFPGITDRVGEVEALTDLIAEFGIRQVQTRNLALDPEQYMAVARSTAHASDAMGIAAMIRRLRTARKGLVVGNFARGLQERGDWAPIR
jgi:wyosine [tRNA(Phe)-imidazoG37] synthetase (radical SAM superfamily)